MDCDAQYCHLDDCIGAPAPSAQLYSCAKPTFNLKCIVLTVAMAAAYWFLPRRNVIVLLIILYGTYLALAWYDYEYDCQRNMGPTYLSLFYAAFKPPHSKQIETYHKWHPWIKRRVMLVDVGIASSIVAATFLWWAIVRR